MTGKAIAQRTEALRDAVESELRQFENRGWTGESALGAADALAKAEYENKQLRTIGENIGDVDVHSLVTARAGTARRTIAAMFNIVSEASNVVGTGDPLLAQFSGNENLEAAEGAGAAYRLIEALFEEVIEDADASLEAASQREEAIGLFERDRSVADEVGTVWFSEPSGRLGITRETLTAKPSARSWGLEFAADLAGIAWSVEGVAYEEELATLKAPVTSRVVASIVSSIVLTQGQGPLERWREAFFEDALIHCYELTEPSRYEDEELSEYESDCREGLRHLLDTGRAFAAGVTAYAALWHALEQEGLK